MPDLHTTPVPDPAASPLPTYPPRIVSGLQPRPTVHLGHWVGAIQDLVRVQNEYPGDTFYIVADYHALSHGIRGEVLRRDTVEMVTALLALGLDPNKTILYRQSDIPACAELVWYVSCVIPISDLTRIGPYREMLRAPEAPTAGGLLYPLLMAADVLCLRGTVIQVGQDQQLNAEIVRSVAARLNDFFDREVFPVPQVHFSGRNVVPGIDGEPMSLANGNHIGLFEPFYQVQEKVRAIAGGDGDAGDGRDSTLYRLCSVLESPQECEEIAELCRRSQEEARRRLVGTFKERFAEAEERYHRLKQDPAFVLDVLREGVRQAQQEARRTLDRVRDLLGLEP